MKGKTSLLPERKMLHASLQIWQALVSYSLCFVCLEMAELLFLIPLRTMCKERVLVKASQWVWTRSLKYTACSPAGMTGNRGEG